MVSEEERVLMQGVIDALRPLSPLKRRVVFGLAKGLTQKAAGRAAGYKAKHPETSVCLSLRDPETRSALNKLDLAAFHGLTKDSLFRKHTELIDAKKLVNTSEGTKEVPDNSTQAKILELGYKVLDVLKEESTVLVETHESRMRRLRAGDCD